MGTRALGTQSQHRYNHLSKDLLVFYILFSLNRIYITALRKHGMKFSSGVASQSASLTALRLSVEAEIQQRLPEIC